MITKSRQYAFIKDENGEDTLLPNPKFLQSCMRAHVKENARLQKLRDYYVGQDINKVKSDDVKINNAKNIVDTISGYVFAEPIVYGGGNVEAIVDWFRLIGEDRHNTELGLDMGIYGKAYELEYMDDYLGNGDIMPVMAKLSPLNTFIVYDTDLKKTPIMGITYSENKDLDDVTKGYSVIVYTDIAIFNYTLKDLEGSSYELVCEPEQHEFAGVPLIRLTNGSEEQADFEQAISLIEAYDNLFTNRVVDKQKFVDSILMVSNMCMGDNQEEVAQIIESINKNRLLEVGDGGTAQWLSKTLSESDIEVLKKALRDEIHTITKCPNLTDENFVGNASGEAMKYKVMGLEQVGKTKESYFKKFLRERFKVLAPVLQLKGIGVILSDITLSMKRTLPKNELERLQILQGTEGILSLKTRLSRYDEELDVEAELEQIRLEQEEKNKSMAQAYNPYQFNNEQDTESKETSEDEVTEQEDDMQEEDKKKQEEEKDK